MASFFDYQRFLLTMKQAADPPTVFSVVPKLSAARSNIIRSGDQIISVGELNSSN